MAVGRRIATAPTRDAELGASRRPVKSGQRPRLRGCGWYEFLPRVLIGQTGIQDYGAARKRIRREGKIVLREFRFQLIRRKPARVDEIRRQLRRQIRLDARRDHYRIGGYRQYLA